MRIWTLLHIGEHDENPVTVFTDEDALWEQIRGDAEQAQRDRGVPMPEDRQMWPEYILDTGWKVSAYEVLEHEVEFDPDFLGRSGSSADLDAADSHEVAS